jgi:hypothetical protein
MSASKIKCEECGNDGTDGSLYLTIDAKWRDGVWELEEREDEGGGELDCLNCDHRTEAPEGIFPYGMTFGLGRMAAVIKCDPRELAQLVAIRDILANVNANSEPDAMGEALTAIQNIVGTE